MNIRVGGSSDLDALMSLEAQCFDVDQWGRQAWLDELDGSGRVVLLATAPDTVCSDDGCQAFDRLVSAACFHAAADTSELYRVMTSPDCRGLGLATLLLVRGFEWAAGLGATEMLLEVRAGNTARALYTDVGFVPLYERTNYYGPGLDAVVMRCELVARPMSHTAGRQP